MRGSDDNLVRVRPVLDRAANFAGLLTTDADDPGFSTLRRSELIGRPLGSGDFQRRAEALLGRALAPLKRGPKPKAAASP